MLTYQIPADSTDVSVVIRIVDSTDGTPETGVVFNTAGIDLEYRREGAASTDITEATLAALTTAHTDGGFLHIGNGYYRLDLPDAAVAAGAAGVLVHGTVTGMVVIGCYIQLSARVNANVTHFNGTAGTFASGRPEVNTSHLAGTAVSASAGLINANVTQVSGDATAADNLEAVLDGTGGVTLVASAITLTTPITANATQISGDSTAADNLETAFDDTAGAVPWLGITDQGTAQSATATTLVLRAATPFGADNVPIGSTLWAFGSTQGYWQVRSITDYVTATDTATVEAWDVTPSGTITYKVFGTAPSSGGGGGLDAAGVRAAVGLASANLDTQLSGIQSDTNDIQTRLPAALVGGRMDSNVGAISSDATAADNLEAALDGTGGVTITAAVTGNITGNLSGSVGSVTGNVGGTINGLTATAQGNVRTAVGLASADLDTQLGTIDTNVDAILDDTGTTGVEVAAGAVDAAALAADAAQEIRDAITAATLAELSGDPGATPSLAGAIMLLYMALRNLRETTATTDQIHNNAGTAILEADIADDGTTFSKSEYAAP